MGEGSPQWIVVRNWDRFQHYTDRDPRWIKNYTDLTADEDYLSLSGHRRGVLHGVWLEYARSNGRLPLDTSTISRRLALRVLSPDLEALNHAGFIEFSASRPLALTRSQEKRREEKKETSSPSAKKTEDPKPVNMPPTDGVRYIKKLIKNGTITDQVDLDAELAHYHLAKNLEAELRSLVQQ